MPFTSESAKANGRKGGLVGGKAGIKEAPSDVKKMTSVENGKRGGRPVTLDCRCGALDGQKHRQPCPLYYRQRRGTL